MLIFSNSAQPTCRKLYYYATSGHDVIKSSILDILPQPSFPIIQCQCLLWHIFAPTLTTPSLACSLACRRRAWSPTSSSTSSPPQTWSTCIHGSRLDSTNSLSLPCTWPWWHTKTYQEDRQSQALPLHQWLTQTSHHVAHSMWEGLRKLGTSLVWRQALYIFF